jgi:hypothetical protein
MYERFRHMDDTIGRHVIGADVQAGQPRQPRHASHQRPQPSTPQLVAPNVQARDARVQTQRFSKSNYTTRSNVKRSVNTFIEPFYHDARERRVAALDAP